MLSDKWIHSTIREMQVADSIRYREAVTRLKRLLYDSHYKVEPSTMKSQNERRNYAQKLTEEFEKEDDIEISQDLETSTSSGILGMVKQQDELITQLEKENNFLKAEMASTIEVSKEITLQNEEFRKRLTDTLAQMDVSLDISLQPEGQDKVQEILNCLKEEREHLLEGLKLQEETIATLRKREIAALDKVKEAIELAEDSQKISEKVRNSSESSHSELQTQMQILHDQLLTTQKQLKRAKAREKENEKIILHQERSLLILEDEKKNLGTITSKQEMELAKKVRELDIKIRESESDKQRLEKLLREQKKTSESTLKRLEALLDRRNLEAETFMARRSSLEKQIRDAKDENMRLIETVTELAKDRGQKTDDDKYAKQLSEIPVRTREELNEIKTTVKNHQDSIISLQDAVVSVREEMTKGMDDLRENLEELCSTIKEGKVDVKDSVETPSRNEAEVHKNIAVSNEQRPHSSRSEGYESLSESTQPSIKLIERRAKTEQMDDPSSSNAYDQSFSKIIVPLPRKVVQSGAVIKMKENILEPKDIDESETKGKNNEMKPLNTVIKENEESIEEKINIGSLEVLKENEAEEDEDAKGNETEATNKDNVKEERNCKVEDTKMIEKTNPPQNGASEIDLVKNSDPSSQEIQNKIDNEEVTQQIEESSPHTETIKEDIAMKNADVLAACEDQKPCLESSNLSSNVSISHRDTKDGSLAVHEKVSNSKEDSSTKDPELISSIPDPSNDSLVPEEKEGSSKDTLKEDSSKLEPAKDKVSDETLTISSDAASSVEVLKEEGEDKSISEDPQRGAAIYKTTFENKFESMDALENVQNEFETVEEDVNSSEEGSLNGKDVSMVKENKNEKPDETKDEIKEEIGESEQNVQDNSNVKDIKDTAEDVDDRPDSTSDTKEAAEMADEN